VLETEGVTPDMIAHQQEQAELLQKLLTVDTEEVNSIIKEREDDIDEGFFVLLRTLLDAAEQANQEDQAIKLINLQAKLYRQTEFGRHLEKQQQVLRAFNQDVQKSGGLDPKLLLKYVLANREDEQLIKSLVSIGRPAFNYEFFILLSERIDKREKSGINTEELYGLREQLLQLQEEMEKESRRLIENAQKTLNQMVEASDREKAVRSNISKVDNLFMHLLTSSIEESKRRGDSNRLTTLEEIHKLIIEEMDRQAPPEIRLINNLLLTPNEEEQLKLLEENEHLVTPELSQMLDLIGEEAEGSGGEELKKRLNQVKGLIQRSLSV
jgi:hypothetical protein